MKKLFAAADRYVETGGWKIIAVLKFCLISLGMLAGMLVRPEHKKAVFSGALGVFLATYVPLMARFFRIIREQRQTEG